MAPFLATTGDDGSYEMAKLPPGAYMLICSKTGYVDAEYHPDDRIDATTIRLTKDEKREGIDFHLSVAAAVTGSVVTEEGEPAVGAVVQAWQRSYVRGNVVLHLVSTPSKTDDHGNYRLFGLAQGRYYISAASDPHNGRTAYAVTYYPHELALADARTIEVSMGAEVHGVNLTVKRVKTYTVTGVLKGADGPVGETYSYAQPGWIPVPNRSDRDHWTRRQFPLQWAYPRTLSCPGYGPRPGSRRSDL